MCPLFLHTTLSLKWRASVHLNTQIVSTIGHLVQHEDDNLNDYHGFLEEQQVLWGVLLEAYVV